jgi:hypothetical protein
MKNRHGFATMMPTAKLLHPFIGVDGGECYPVFQSGGRVYYGTDFCESFKNRKIGNRHVVKLFFPEIKHGLLYVDEAKYSVIASKEDEGVVVTSEIVRDGKYEEYFVIKDFKAEFEIEVQVDFGKRGSITDPVEVICDFIDIFVHNQRISLVTHDNNFLFIPYEMSYRKNLPPEIARTDSASFNVDASSDPDYAFIINRATKEKLESKGFECPPIDLTMLRIKQIEIEERYADFNMEQTSSISKTIKDKKNMGSKFLFSLPEAIFPEKLACPRLVGEGGVPYSKNPVPPDFQVPIFDSDMIDRTCSIIRRCSETPHYEKYKVLASDAPPPVCTGIRVCSAKQVAQSQLQNKNLVIDGYLIFAELSWEKLDKLDFANKVYARRARGIKDKAEVEIEEELV